MKHSCGECLSCRWLLLVSLSLDLTLKVVEKLVSLSRKHVSLLWSFCSVCFLLQEKKREKKEINNLLLSMKNKSVQERERDIRVREKDPPFSFSCAVLGPSIFLSSKHDYQLLDRKERLFDSILARSFFSCICVINDRFFLPPNTNLTMTSVNSSLFFHFRCLVLFITFVLNATTKLLDVTPTQQQHVQHEMKKECKCHGMSGSCTVKTCWMRLPSFRDIGNNIKDKFEGASRVSASNEINLLHGSTPSIALSTNPNSSRVIRKKMNRRRATRQPLTPYDPSHKIPDMKDLVYYEQSPDFCKYNPSQGMTGTRGRVCNDTSSGVDGCELMCCGRGYKTEIREEFERCRCVFKWCCTVQCEICKVRRMVHTCL